MTKSLFLFLDLLPLFPVDGISAADEVVGAGLDHTSQSTEQPEDSGGGLPVDMMLYFFKKLGGIFVTMAGGCFQPLHAYFQALRYSLSETVDLAKLVFCIRIALFRCQFKHGDGFLDVSFQVLLAYSVYRIYTTVNGGIMQKLLDFGIWLHLRLTQALGANVAGSMDYDHDRARKALMDAGFGDRLATLEKGLDTMLYKDLSEDGVDVSGGEAQKIAIARALYKDAPFIILDEPTAALDPIAEAEIYAKFNDIAGDKTAIYISHRLSSCKFCDEIAVFHEGAVIQQGTHAELVADENGKYHELWHAQAQYYTEKTG